jgi:galactokinase
MVLAKRQFYEFAAPARVNLLGEHTDYTGGLVLPMAIPFYTTAHIAPREDAQYRFTSESFDGERIIGIDDCSEAAGTWADYPVGVLRQLQQREIKPAPFELHLHGNVPFGAGLSSSASVEVASALAMLAFADAAVSAEELAVLCRRAENEYVHSPCGIMDQFVIVSAMAAHALLLDTASLAFEHIPLNRSGFADTCFVVCNSMVKHSVACGEYPIRRRQVEEGQAAIRAAFPGVRDLGQATLNHLQACEPQISREAFLRCRHIITENDRVRQAKEALRAGDPAAFGQLMLTSHASQRDDFACSCPEIDFLVDTAAELPECFGARLTGGGFGGCTVNLVLRQQADAFTAELKRVYRDHFGITAETYICDAVDGAVLHNARIAEERA